MTEHQSDRLLSQMLDELGSAEPPADFTRTVMSHITNHPGTIHRTYAKPNREGTTMTRKAMWGLAAAAAILLAIFVVRGFPPTGPGTESTIGAAQRYQAPQIAESDVVLGDAAVQEFLQSDTFERVMTDPEVRSLLADARLNAVLQDAALRNALLAADMRKALANRDLQAAFANPDVRQALDNAQLRDLYAGLFKKVLAELQAANARPVQTAALQSNNEIALIFKASEAALRQLAADAAIRQAVGDAALRQLVENSAARIALADVSVRNAIENAAVRHALSQDVFRAMIARSNMAEVLGRQAFLDAIAHQAFGAALISRSFQSQLAGAATAR